MILPKLPGRKVLLDSRGYTPEQMREYALKAIELYKEKQHEKAISYSGASGLNGLCVDDLKSTISNHGQRAATDEPK